MEKVFKIAVVGDLSLGDPNRLTAAMSAACNSHPNVVVQLGDCHPGYNVLKYWKALGDNNRTHGIGGWDTLAIPGEDDIDWDTQLVWPRTWYRYYSYPGGDPPAVYLIGLDNSDNRFGDIWPMLRNVPDDAPLVIFCHKPLSPIVLPDGARTHRVMGEGEENEFAGKMRDWCRARNADEEVMLVHGHYHGWTLFDAGYGNCLVDGRGGAAPRIGWSSIVVTEDGLSIFKHNV